MPLAISPTKAAHKSKPGQKFANSSDSAFAVAEINAYIAIRDELLDEAEKLRTAAKLDSVTVANDFVQGCLRPARELYTAQSLAESDAARQRKRCDAVRDRIAKLRAAIVQRR